MQRVGPDRRQRSPRGITYQPALDGLRGLALLAIAVYHSGVGSAPGAFLSVSTFFTLSGFLITALLLREHETNGRISLHDFWTRRLRRLMPAALLAIVAITVATTVLGDSTQLERLRGDALASLGYVANWRFVLAGDSYAAIFSAPSPFTHFWTLAIEEQFYVLFPPVLAWLVTRARGRRRPVAVALTLIVAASVGWSTLLVAHGTRLDRLYFGTDTRLAELVAGGLLALWWLGRPEPRGGARTATRVASTVALAAVVTLWLTAQRESWFWYRGGLTLYAVLTLVVILGATQRRGPVRRLLSVRPLVWVGTVSYAGYLFHWPVLVWLAQHTSLPAWSRLIIGVTVALALAALSQRFVERPIRAGSWSHGRTVVAALSGVATASVAVLLVAALSAPAAPTIDFAAAAARRAELATRAEATPTASREALRVATFGDSTALMTGAGLAEWGFAHPSQWIPANGWSGIGCGLLTHVTRLTKGEELPDPADCADWQQQWAADADAHHPDITVVQLGPWEVVGQRIDRTGPFRSIDDSRVATLIRHRLDDAVDILRSRSRLVVLLLSPDIDVGRVDGRSPARAFPESDPARMEAFRQMLRAVDARYDDVTTVDLAGWLAARPDERILRPDGVHFPGPVAARVAEWLAPRILRAADAAHLR